MAKTKPTSSKASAGHGKIRVGRDATSGQFLTKAKGFAGAGKVARAAKLPKTVVAERGSEPKRERQTDKVELRVSPVAKSRLQAAAVATRKTVSAFLLDSGLDRADMVLADRTLFVLDDKTYDAFVTVLEAPTRPKPRLARLLTEPSVVD